MGQVFSGLTKPGAAEARQAAQGARIETGLAPITGTLDNPIVGQAPAPIETMPAMKAPSFQNAGPDNLTTKGKIFSTVLSLAQGALLGDPRTSEGYQRAAMFPNKQRAAALETQNQELQNQIDQQNLAHKPLLFDLNARNINSQIAENEAQAIAARAMAERRGLFNVPGTGLVNVSGETPVTVIPAPPPQPKIVGNLNSGIAQVDNGKVTVLQPPAAKPVSPKAPNNDRNISLATRKAAEFLNSHGNNVEAALADFNAQIANRPDLKDIGQYVVKAIRAAGNKPKPAQRPSGPTFDPSLVQTQ